MLRGRRGDDWLSGGAGSNWLTGGTGSDTFFFRDAREPDRITDFGSCDLVALGLAGLGPAGPLDADAFHRGADAETPEQRILYDSDAGWLLYAPEGSDTAHPQRIVEVGRGLPLDAGDILVV